MKKRALEYLVCPDCKKGLHIESTEYGGAEIKEGRLICKGCGASYDIRGGIPRFVPTDLYVGSFSYEWKKFKKVQLDSESESGNSREGMSRIIDGDPSELSGIVLDAGCGTGRYMEIVSPHAKEVFGIDLSLACETAQELVGGKENVHVIQADINRLPFKEQTFDSIYSIGVLHHTPSTEDSFMNLPPLLKKGGKLAIWIYSNEGIVKKLQNPFREFYRLFTTRMPLKLVYLLSHIAIPLQWVYHVFPPIYIIFPFARHPDPQHRVLDTFDAYSPRYVHLHTPEQALGWFERAGLGDIELTMGGQGSRGTTVRLGPLNLELTRENIGVVGKRAN